MVTMLVEQQQRQQQQGSTNMQKHLRSTLELFYMKTGCLCTYPVHLPAPNQPCRLQGTRTYHMSLQTTAAAAAATAGSQQTSLKPLLVIHTNHWVGSLACPSLQHPANWPTSLRSSAGVIRMGT
jgi:hypothetical protein